jgi:transcription antitermination factor NusG
MPWMIAIAKHGCQQRARAVLEKHAENAKRAPDRPMAPGTLETYFPMTREKTKDRTGRSTNKDLYYLGHYFFVRLESNWFNKRDIEHDRNFCFLKLTPDWINKVLNAEGVADVFCSTPTIEKIDEQGELVRLEQDEIDKQSQPLIVSDAYVHNQYKSYEDQSGYIPLKRKLKRGQKIRVTTGLLEGHVGTIAEDFEKDMRRGMVAASLDFMGARRVELPREDFEPIYTEFLRTTKSGVNPGGA